MRCLLKQARRGISGLWRRTEGEYEIWWIHKLRPLRRVNDKHRDCPATLAFNVDILQEHGNLVYYARIFTAELRTVSIRLTSFQNPWKWMTNPVNQRHTLQRRTAWEREWEWAHISVKMFSCGSPLRGNHTSWVISQGSLGARAKNSYRLARRK